MRVIRALLIIAAVAASSSPSTAGERPHCQIVEVTMYMTTWCPYCRQARQYMLEKGVTFSEVDVERTNSPSVRAIGRQGVPMIATERGWIRGFNPAAIDAHLCIR